GTGRPGSRRGRRGDRARPSQPGLLAEAEPGAEWHETDASGPPLGQATGAPLDDEQLLGDEIADRDHEAAARHELLREWGRHARRRGGHDDTSEWRPAGAAARAVPQHGPDRPETRRP